MQIKSDIELPGTITAITPQKKNKDRYSIFVDDCFLIGVDNSTLLNHQLHVGSEITPALFKQLQRDEGRTAVKSYMLKLLSWREHARKELFTKAKRKDYPPEMILSVLDELEEKEFINDRLFAEKFAQDKSILSKWGPYKIRSHLQKKGVNTKISGNVINQVFDSVDLESRYSELIKKRKPHFLREADPAKRKKKIVNYLIQKGYQPGSIYPHIERLMEILSD